MKKLLICLMMTTATYSIAQPLKMSETMSQEKFAQHKSLTLEAMDKREKIIVQEKECVVKSQDIKMLKNCFLEARKNRKEMGNELRSKVAK